MMGEPRRLTHSLFGTASREDHRAVDYELAHVITSGVCALGAPTALLRR